MSHQPGERRTEYPVLSTEYCVTISCLPVSLSPCLPATLSRKERRMNVLDKFRLNGRRALITGASRGLGRAMAQALAEAGADLVLVGRDPASLEQARHELSELGHRIETVAADLSTPSGAQQLCESVLSHH